MPRDSVRFLFVRATRWIGALGLSTALVAATASATQILAQPIATLASQADRVVHAQVVAVETVLEGGQILTRARLAPVRAWPSTAPLTPLVVVTPGGRYGDLQTSVPGAERWQQGQEVIALLEAHPDGSYHSLALAYTVFVRVERDSVVGWQRGTAPVDRLVGVPDDVVIPDIAQPFFAQGELEALLDAALPGAAPTPDPNAPPALGPPGVLPESGGVRP